MILGMPKNTATRLRGYRSDCTVELVHQQLRMLQVAGVVIKKLAERPIRNVKLVVMYPNLPGRVPINIPFSQSLLCGDELGTSSLATFLSPDSSACKVEGTTASATSSVN